LGKFASQIDFRLEKRKFCRGLSNGDSHQECGSNWPSSFIEDN
jgi:hypothetical protein